MLASITPLGERGRGARWWRTVSAHLVGSGGAGAAFGAALGAAGRLLHAPVGLVVALAALGLAADLARRLPTVHRQVDETWLLAYRDWVYGAGFGVQLGVGVVTIVPSAAVYLTWLLALLSRSPWAGAVVGGTFGLVRALPLLTFADVRRPEQLRARHRAWQRWAPAGHRAALAAQGAVALGLVAGALR